MFLLIMHVLYTFFILINYTEQINCYTYVYSTQLSLTCFPSVHFFCVKFAVDISNRYILAVVTLH